MRFVLGIAVGAVVFAAGFGLGARYGFQEHVKYEKMVAFISDVLQKAGPLPTP